MRSFLDPSSAQWRDLYLRGIVLCGEVNAKNAYGAYVGFRRFFAAPDMPGADRVEQPDYTDGQREAFDALCAPKMGPRIDVPSQ